MLEVHDHILALPKSPTSAASSNNNKTWKGLFCPLYSYNKMDVDLAMLFPSVIWQCSLSLSPSLPCEEWAQLITGIRLSSGSVCWPGKFFPFDAHCSPPLVSHARFAFSKLKVIRSHRPEAASLPRLHRPDHPKGIFPCSSHQQNILYGLSWSIKLFPSSRQREPKAVRKKCSLLH